MALNEEILRLAVETNGAKGVQDLQRSIDLTRGSLDALADAYRRGDVTQEQFALHARPLADRLSTMEDAAGRATGKLKGLGQGAQATGRFFQDLVQGGFAGVLNNLEQVGTSIGALLGKGAAFGAALGGAFTVIGTAAYVAGPAVWGFFSRLIEGSNKVPTVTSGLKGLEAGLKATTDALDKLKEKQSLTNRELVSFIRLTAEQVAQEAKLEAARKEKAAADAVKNFKTAPQQEQAKVLAEQFAEEPGGPDAMTAAVAKQLGKERAKQKVALAEEEQKLRGRGQEIGERARQGKATQGELNQATADLARLKQLKKERAALEETSAQRTERARGLIGLAMGGDQAAEQKLLQFQRERPDLYTAGQKEAVQSASPEQLALEKRGQEQGRQEQVKQELAAARQKKEHQEAENRREAMEFEEADQRTSGKDRDKKEVEFRRQMDTLRDKDRTARAMRRAQATAPGASAHARSSGRPSVSPVGPGTEDMGQEEFGGATGPAEPFAEANGEAPEATMPRGPRPSRAEKTDQRKRAKEQREAAHLERVEQARKLRAARAAVRRGDPRAAAEILGSGAGGGAGPGPEPHGVGFRSVGVGPTPTQDPALAAGLVASQRANASAFGALGRQLAELGRINARIGRQTQTQTQTFQSRGNGY